MKTYKQLLIGVDQLSDFIRANPTKSYHEVFHSKHINLVFDLDGHVFNDDLFELEQIVKSYIGQQYKMSYLKSSGDKQSYHCFFNVNVTIEYARFIAE